MQRVSRIHFYVHCAPERRMDCMILRGDSAPQHDFMVFLCCFVRGEEGERATLAYQFPFDDGATVVEGEVLVGFVGGDLDRVAVGEVALEDA